MSSSDLVFVQARKTALRIRNLLDNSSGANENEVLAIQKALRDFDASISQLNRELEILPVDRRVQWRRRTDSLRQEYVSLKDDFDKLSSSLITFQFQQKQALEVQATRRQLMETVVPQKDTVIDMKIGGEIDRLTEIGHSSLSELYNQKTILNAARHKLYAVTEDIKTGGNLLIRIIRQQKIDTIVSIVGIILVLMVLIIAVIWF